MKNIYILFDRLRFSFPIKKINGKLKFVLHEKYRLHVKYVKYILAVVGLLTSLLSFSSISISFFVSLVMFLLGVLFERIVFRFSTLFVTPVSLTFNNIDLKNWIAAGFGYYEDNHSNQIPVITWIFSDVDTANSIHELLLKWSHGQVDDKEKLINISIIINERKKQYDFLLFPSLNRPGQKEFIDEAVQEKKTKKETFDDIHESMYFMQTIRKNILISNQSYLSTFKNRLPENCPVLLSFQHANKYDDTPENIDRLKNLVIHNLRIKDFNKLTRKDPEYGLMRV